MGRELTRLPMNFSTKAQSAQLNTVKPSARCDQPT